MKNHLYIAACDDNGGIYHYILREDGIPFFCDRISLPRPMYICANGTQIHVLLRAPWENSLYSGLCTLVMNPDGSLQKTEGLYSTDGIVACHLSADGNAIYTANYLSGSLTKLLTASSYIKTVRHTGHSIHPTRQTEAHTHYIAPIPNTEYLAAVDLGEDRIYVYDQQLHVITYVSMPAGCGPRHLAWSEDGRYAYCACELSSEIIVLSFTEGKFTCHERYSTLPNDVCAEDYNNTASAIRCYGRLVAVSNRGHDSVSLFQRIDERKLQMIGTVSSVGQSPRDFDMIGDLLICANENSNNVTIQKLIVEERSYSTVLCADIKDIPSPLCVVWQ